MTRCNFAKISSRDSVRQPGHEPVDGADLFPDAPKAKISKSSRREIAASLLSPSSMITKIIECKCGHKGKVRIPLARAGGPFRCVKCQNRTP